MAYQIYEFAGVALPLYNPTQDHNVAIQSTLALAVGGVADYYGSRRRLPQITQFAVKGIYAGELYYLATEGGDNLVDHSGNLIIAHDPAAELRIQLDALRGVVGTRGVLSRRRWDDLATQWKTARLLQVRRSTDLGERTQRAQVECTFEAVDARWRAAAQSSVSANLVSGGTLALNLDNTGAETVEDAIVTLTASGTITSVTLAVSAAGVTWSWAGSLASGQALVVDCGAQTVRKAGADSYSGFSLGAGHSARTWLPLAPGISNLQITSNGPGTVNLAFYPQFL